MKVAQLRLLLRREREEVQDVSGHQLPHWMRNK
jgi:hypothetical protein